MTSPAKIFRFSSIMKSSITAHLLTTLFLCAIAPVSAVWAADKPNILLIVSDDHGYGDVGFQGCKDIPTPHLDQLAREGVHCTSGYVSHPYCSPTRAGLMTGRYQQRFGHENNPSYKPNDHKEGLPMSEKLLPEFLASAGYKTGWIGKWHLGAAPEFRPENSGFAETFGFIGGGHKYLNWQVNPKMEYLVPIERNGKPVEVTEHLTVAFGKEAADFVKRHKGEPWFLYLAFNAPHLPHEPTAERLARFASIQDPIRRKYAAQVSLLDDAIGETLEALRASGQEKDTLVFFFSDNGGPIKEGKTNGSSNAPLRGGKGDVYDGGIRVPFVVKWPAKFPAGATYDQPVISLDVFATALAVAGAPMPADKKYDGVNLVPFLSGEDKQAPHDLLYWRSKWIWALRETDSKLVRIGKNADELYDLKTDIGESKDLSQARSADARRLRSILDAWNRELIAPAFPGETGGGKDAKPNAN